MSKTKGKIPPPSENDGLVTFRCRAPGTEGTVLCLSDAPKFHSVSLPTFKQVCRERRDVGRRSIFGGGVKHDGPTSHV